MPSAVKPESGESGVVSRPSLARRRTILRPRDGRDGRVVPTADAEVGDDETISCRGGPAWAGKHELRWAGGQVEGVYGGQRVCDQHGGAQLYHVALLLRSVKISPASSGSCLVTACINSRGRTYVECGITLINVRYGHETGGTVTPWVNERSLREYEFS